ncbi:MAG: response regulator [Melioribacteraceae bacterium]|nr:response regulator [Melioribacteraceae bacterium]
MDEKYKNVAREKKEGVLGMIFRRGLSRTLVAWFLLLALVPLVLISSISYYQSKTNLQDSAAQSLEATAKLKTHFIENRFAEYFRDLYAQARNQKNTRFLAELQQAFQASGKELKEFTASYAYAKIVAEHSADLKSFRKIYGYQDVLLIDSDGNLLFSVAGESDLGTNLFRGEFSGTRFANACRKTMETGRHAFSDLEFYAPSDNAVAGFVVDVIIDDAGDKIGLVALQISLDEINTITHDRTGLGETGETHLIGPDLMLRTDCSFNPESKALTTRIATEQARLWHEEHGKEGDAQEAGDMEESTFIYPGPHDGRSVLGIHHNIDIAGTHWAVIAEIEVNEIFAPAQDLGMLTLVLLGGTALIVLLLAVSVTRRIVSPLLILSDTTRSIADGNFDQEISVNARNEIGDLAANFRNMLAGLQEAKSTTEAEDWLKTGQAGLSDVTRGEQDLPTVGRNIITFLAKFLDARIGAFYVATDGVLKLVGSYAYTVRKDLSNEYRFGEGLVGQAALEKETIVLTDVPEDYIKVRSGVGSAGPTSIVVMPVLDNEVVKGVVELGAFRELGERELRLLKQAVEIIGVTISTAQSRVRVQELLEESQRQSEELQAQQEELQSSNEELEEQTQQLKASEEELKQQSEELRVSNEELLEKSNALQLQKREIEKSKQDIENKSKDLEIASKYKSEFLANMSHELRTPLNSFLLLSRGLSENRTGNLDSEQLEDLKIIYEGGSDLLNLINDIMDLSKVEAGKLSVQIEAVDVESVMGNLSNLFKVSAKNKGLEFILEKESTIPKYIQTDSQRLEQILKNFLSNAFKFTENGSITLHIHPCADTVHFIHSDLTPEKALAFSVIDTGIGIPENKQREIFEAFQQEDGTTSRKYGGTGLGLTISRALAKMLGGEIQLTSTPGSGSQFTLYIPYEINHDQIPQSYKEVDENKGADENANSTQPPLASNSNEIYIADDRNNLQKDEEAILIIEDDKNFAKVLMGIVRKNGHRALVAGDGKQGIYLALQYSIKGIFLDLGLPDMDGSKVLEQLKFHLKTKHIPVHVISGSENSKEILQKGAIGFLQKPAKEEDIDNVLVKMEKISSSTIKKILIVDNSEASQKAISGLIKNRGIETFCVSTGQSAIDKIKNASWDCVILDLGLDDMTGFDVLDTLEKTKGVVIPPVIIYSGKELSQDERKKLDHYSAALVLKDAKSLEKLLDEALLFLHSMTKDLSKSQQQTIYSLHDESNLLKDRRVLLVDDDMRNTFALSKSLQQIGMVVQEADNGKLAVQKVEENDNIDIIIMDIMMPIMDGYEAIKRIRKIAKYAKTPIIALTAKAMPEDRKKCIDAGATDYLTKPVDFDKLLSMLKVWLFKK